MRLADSGYHTLAVHGFSSSMFDRNTWYARLGFERSAFLPELEWDGVGMCDGTFPGGCDADVARWIGGRLTDGRDGRPMFVHWMTLNSHLPLPAADARSLSGECGEVGIEQEVVVCSWFTRVLTVRGADGSDARVAADGVCGCGRPCSAFYEHFGAGAVCEGSGTLGCADAAGSAGVVVAAGVVTGEASVRVVATEGVGGPDGGGDPPI